MSDTPLTRAKEASAWLADRAELGGSSSTDCDAQRAIILDVLTAAEERAEKAEQETERLRERLWRAEGVAKKNAAERDQAREDADRLAEAGDKLADAAEAAARVSAEYGRGLPQIEVREAEWRKLRQHDALKDAGGAGTTGR